MLDSLLTETGSLTLLIVVLLFLVVVLLLFLVMNNRRMSNMTYPVYDFVVKDAQKKANQITHDAMKESRKILTEAELAGIKTVAKSKVESKHVEADYEEQLDALTQETQTMLTKYGEHMDAELARLTDALEKRIAVGIQKNENFLQEETDKLSKQLASTFGTLEANAKEQIRSNVEAEFIGVKKVIETYRQERFALIDNELLSLIENTTQVALQKSLNLADHTDLLYKALEEAKSKGSFS